MLKPLKNTKKNINLIFSHVKCTFKALLKVVLNKFSNTTGLNYATVCHNCST